MASSTAGRLLAFLAASLMLIGAAVVSAPAAVAETITPTLDNPASGSTWALTSPITFTYGMYSPQSGTGRLLITPLDSCSADGTTLMNVSVGVSVSYFMYANNLDSGSSFDQYVLEGPTTLRENCQYSFTLSYQNTNLDPASFATNTPITIDSGTATPTLDAPASSSNLQDPNISIAFTLPDSPLTDSIQLTFTPVDSACGGSASIVDVNGTDVRALTLDRTNLANSADVRQVTGPTALQSGCRYDLTVSYQDFRSSPRSSATNTNIQIGVAPETVTPTPTPAATPALRIGESKKLKALLKGAGKPLSKRMRITKFVNATPAQCRAQRRTFLVTGVAAGTCSGVVVERPKNGRGKVKRVKLSFLVG